MWVEITYPSPNFNGSQGGFWWWYPDLYESSVKLRIPCDVYIGRHRWGCFETDDHARSIRGNLYKNVTYTVIAQIFSNIFFRVYVPKTFLLKSHWWRRHGCTGGPANIHTVRCLVFFVWQLSILPILFRVTSLAPTHDVVFDLRLNKRLSKQSRRRYLRRHRGHYDVTVMGSLILPWRHWGNLETLEWCLMDILTSISSALRPFVKQLVQANKTIKIQLDWHFVISGSPPYKYMYMASNVNNVSRSWRHHGTQLKRPQKSKFRDTFYWHGLTLIPTWSIDYMANNAWD